MKRHSMKQALVAVALAALCQAAAAQAQPEVVLGQAHARGLSALGAAVAVDAAGYTVSTRVSRSVMSGILAPVTLKVVVRGSDGAIRAERQQALGPAELPRRRTRAFRFDSQLEVAPAAGDTIEVSLAG